MRYTGSKRAGRAVAAALIAVLLSGALCGCIAASGPKGYAWTALDDSVLDGAEIVGLPISVRSAVKGGGMGGAAPGNYYLAQRDGLYGLLTIDGEWAVEPAYQDLLYGFCYYLQPGDSYDDAWTLDENGDLQQINRATAIGTASSGGYGWDPDARRFWFGQDALYAWAAEGEPAEAVPVIQYRLTEQDGGLAIHPEDLARLSEPAFSLKALTVGGEILTDFVYEQIAAESGGLCAVKRDGKWGYLNTAGELVIPCAYDGCRSTDPGYPQTLEDKSHLTEEELSEYLAIWNEDLFASPCMGGYVLLYQNGQAALYTDEGEEAVPFGVFEALTEVTDGRCFAKWEGRWGVLTLES